MEILETKMIDPSHLRGHSGALTFYRSYTNIVERRARFSSGTSRSA
jgi:hypothetical protein